MTFRKGRSLKTKAELDRIVATRLGLPRREVSDITFEFIEAVRELIVKEGTLSIPRLGSFNVFSCRVLKYNLVSVSGVPTSGKTREIRVNFSKSRNLQEDLRRAHGKARR